MKSTKTCIVLLLATVMLVLCACGGNKVTPASAQEATAETAAEPSDAPLTVAEMQGVLEGRVYTNEFIGIGCELNDEWTYLNSEQLLELGGAVAEALPEDVSQMMENGNVLYAMYASADGGLRAASIVYEMMNDINGIVADESSYIDISMPQLSQAMEKSGLNVSACEQTKVTFAGAERECIHIEREASGVMFYQNLIPIKRGNYMVVCAFSSFQTDNLDEIGGAFYTLQ